MSEREQSHGLALLGGIGLLLALAALWSQALPEHTPSPSARPQQTPLAPRLTPSPASAPAPHAELPSPSPSPSPSRTPAPVLLGNTRGRAAIELMGPSGPPVKTWVEGKVLDPSGAPLAGAQVWLESSSEEVLVQGETAPDGSFSLETTYEADQIPRSAPRKVVARRELAGGVARAEQWIRVPGPTRQLELKAQLGFDLELRFPFAIRSEVILGGRPGPVRKLPARRSAPLRQLPGEPEGELWVAVVGVDASGGWWAGQRQGRLGDQAEPHWEIPLAPLAKVAVTVRGPAGAPSPAKLVAQPLEGNRFRESTLQRSGQVLDFEEEEEEGPELPEFGTETKGGRGTLSLTPGPWRVSAFGPPGTAPAHVRIEVSAGRAGDRELALKLGVGLTCEFELPVGAREGELAVHGPAGAYLEDLGEGRWRVAGLTERAHVEVYLLHSEATPDDEELEEGAAPLDEPAPTSCAQVKLTPGAREKLALVRTASLRVLLPQTEGDEDWVVTVEDAATSRQPHSIVWDLEDDPLTPSGPWVTDDSPRDQAWLQDRQGGMTFTNFERVPGSRTRSSDVEGEAILLQDLFPGAVRITATGPGGFETSRTLELVAGERTILDLTK
jgi:hypothetical protein